MSSEGVKKVLGRVMTDDSFAKEFFEKPGDTLARADFDLSAGERTALMGIRSEDLQFDVTKSSIGPGLSPVAVTIESLRVSSKMPSRDSMLRERVINR